MERKMNEFQNVATFRYSQGEQSFVDSEAVRDGDLDPQYIQPVVERREAQYLDSKSS